MAEQITLTPLVNLENQTTAVNAINANNAVITTAFTDVLSLTGVTPNAMQSQLDMNSNQIINLPDPATDNSPLRLQDLNTFIGGGTVTNIPSGGSTGDTLVKTSNSNYAVGWSANTADIAAGTNISLSGSNPTTISVVNSPSFSGGLTVPGTSTNQPTILRSVTGGNPTSTGNTDPNNVIVLGNPEVSFRIGLYFNGDVWWQPCLSSSYATNTNSVFNPNGGNVGIGVAAPSFNLQVAGTTSIGGALTYGGVTLSNSVTGTGSMVLNTLPSFNFITGSTNDIAFSSANTGFQNGLEINNSGTVSNASTEASIDVALTASSNVYAILDIVGGANPTANLTTGSSVTGGFNISAGAGTLTITSPTLTTPALGTPASGVLTNCTGTASGLTAGTASAVAASGITGTTLASSVTASSLTSFGSGIALGTPASGTVTNLTGTASININGTVGATTPTTGSFTTLAASSTVSGTGFATYLASPPAIGGTAPAAGTFTTLATNVAPTTVSNTSELIGSAQTINKRMPVTLSGTVYWIPCSSTAF